MFVLELIFKIVLLPFKLVNSFNIFVAKTLRVFVDGVFAPISHLIVLFLFGLFLFPSWDIAAFFSVLFTVIAYLTVYSEGDTSGVFGKSRFATHKELKQAGLVGPGIVFGKMKGKLVEKPPELDGHVLVIGGSGMGKSKSVAIPTLMRWPGSVICVDIKGELSQTTQAFRPGKTYIFDPTIENGDWYNPMDFIQTFRDAQELARALVPTPEKADPFWTQAARNVLSGMLMEGRHQGATLSEVAYTVMASNDQKIIEFLHESDDPNVRAMANQLDLPPETLGGVMSVLRSHLSELATDEGMELSTSRSDWTPQSLEEEGSTIYLRVPEHLISQYRPLWTLIFQQVIAHLTKRQEKQNPPILLLMDEFPQLGKIPKFNEALSTLRSRNVHIMIFAQSLAQLDEIYGQNGRKIICDNCRYKLVLGASDVETQKYFSDLSGQMTIRHASTSQSQSQSDRVLDLNKQVSHQTNKTETGVPLIRPEEWAKLDRPVLFSFKNHPAKVEQVWYNTDPVLKRLMQKQ